MNYGTVAVNAVEKGDYASDGKVEGGGGDERFGSEIWGEAKSND